MKHRPITLYVVFLVAQTVLAILLFALTFPIFHAVMNDIGQPQDLDYGAVAAIVLVTGSMQTLYWWRQNRVPLSVPIRNMALSHLALFAARASFFFGGALFSLVFFRHVPELPNLPPPAQALAKAVAVFSVLFALFCYSLELERLGRAMDDTTRS